MGMNMAKMQEMEALMHRTVVWVSAGAASGVAGYLISKQDPDAIYAYLETRSEHPDNERFLQDLEKWYGKPIARIGSDKYTDIWDVFEKTRWLVGVNGARCTTELKKMVRQDFERPGDIQVFGYTIEEQDRVARFVKNNPEMTVSCPLIDKKLSKADCFDILEQAGIELPELYKLGYKNNNCIGCPKGQSSYWNRIRVTHPDVFERMSKVERDLDVAINKSYAGDGERKRVFLDELDPKAGRDRPEPNISCGLFCGQYLEDEN